MRKIIDLHIHSVYSDGYLTPEQIVARAVENEVSLIALTDHDTLDGIPEFLVEARRANLPVLYGVEFTTRMNGRDLHILAYNFRPTDERLNDLIYAFNELQALFNLQRISNFEENTGQTIDLSLIPAHGNLTPIRLAYWLLETGKLSPDEFPAKIRDIYPLFERDSRDFELNYAPHLPLAEDVVEIIREAGGFPVLAHPQSMEVTFEEVYKLYARGLKGIEAFYPEQNPYPYLEWASRLGLAVTAGTDYHGVLDRNERSIGFSIEEELPRGVYLYTGDISL